MAEEVYKEIPYDEKLAVVGNWILRFDAKGKVGEIDRSLLKEVLEGLGANLKEREGLNPLSGYTNKSKRSGLNEAWGEEKVDGFWEWINDYIEEYEESGKTLPGLGKRKLKFSGMRAFFGELTALAAG